MTGTSKEQGIDKEEYEKCESLAKYLLGLALSYKNADYLIHGIAKTRAAVRSDILRRAKEKAQSFGYLTAMGNTPYVSLSDLTALCTEERVLE